MEIIKKPEFRNQCEDNNPYLTQKGKFWRLMYEMFGLIKDAGLNRQCLEELLLTALGVRKTQH